MFLFNVPVSVKSILFVLKINTWWIISEMWCHKSENRATYQSRFFLLDSNTTSIKQQSLKLDKMKRPQKQNRT